MDKLTKARRMQEAAEKLVQSYAEESTDTDVYRSAVNFRRELQRLSNASLARLHDIFHFMAGE